MIYNATDKGPYKIPGFFDADAKKIIGIIYTPDTWMPNTVYYFRNEDDYDVCIPTTFTGLYHQVINPGKSGLTEPTWATTIGGITLDGTIKWQAVAYNLMPPTELIDTSTWTASNGVTLANPINYGNYTTVRVESVPDGISSFTVTNHIIKDNLEEDDITIQYKVALR